MLTEEQLQHYYREGYIVVPGLIPRASVQAVLKAVPEGFASGDFWRPSSYDHDNPLHDAALHRLLVEPRLIEAVSDIFAAPPRAYWGMLAVVPAHGGRGLPWHQDNQYDQVLGGALNAFIALCDITPDKAILWVAPRSHLLGTQPSQEASAHHGHREAVVEPENGMPLPSLQAGDVCIFDRNTYHRSLRNETAEDRYAYAAQFVAAHARRARDGLQDPKWLLTTELAALWQKHYE
jgi:ectoine hydroxylase-related dioxygenase (phytanoyl-CoA dioxygenase family)